MIDITYIRTHERWFHLCVVIDLFSRCMIGWATRSSMTTDLALQALLMAIWSRKPSDRVTLHSDQGSQFTSREWQTLLRSAQSGRSHEPARHLP